MLNSAYDERAQVDVENLTATIEQKNRDLFALAQEIRSAHNIISGYRFAKNEMARMELDIQVVDAWLKRNDWLMKTEGKP